MVKSEIQNKIISSKNNSFNKIINDQIKRYKDKVINIKKGYGLIFATLISAFCFIILPKIAKKFWPIILYYFKPEYLPLFNLVFATIVHFLM